MENILPWRKYIWNIWSRQILITKLLSYHTVMLSTGGINYLILGTFVYIIRVEEVYINNQMRRNGSAELDTHKKWKSEEKIGPLKRWKEQPHVFLMVCDSFVYHLYYITQFYPCIISFAHFVWGATCTFVHFYFLTCKKVKKEYLRLVNTSLNGRHSSKLRFERKKVANPKTNIHFHIQEDGTLIQGAN